MTSYYLFQPSTTSAPSYIVTLDGNQYKLIVTWNIFGKRYYVNCYALTGELIFNVPLMETPGSIALDTLGWDVASQLVTATTTVPHKIPVGTVAQATITGCNPETYNGDFEVYIEDDYTFTYFVADDPGAAVSPGSINKRISMSAGYFSTAVIYRNSQFEVG